MRFSRLSIFCLMIFLASCGSRFPHEEPSKSAIFAHVEKMKKVNEWMMEYYGGMYYGEDVRKLNVGFIEFVPEELGYEYAKKKLVAGATEFLNSINQNPDMKDRLNHYPFVMKDVEYSILFGTREGVALSHIVLQDGMISYFIFEPVFKSSICWKKEPF